MLPYFLIILLSLGIIWVGCGKKAPPIPPNRIPLQAPIELKAAIKGDEVHLTWRPSTTQTHRRYEILRSTVDAKRPICADCPMIFQKVGRVTVDAAAELMEYKEKVAAGFIYTYKVQCIGSAGDKGPASNGVVIDLSR